MEVTIEQALQQAVAAHREGKIQEAERLYRTILQSQPEHPDANHNLGVLAVSVNKAEAALPLFKIALEANPKIEQFWISYTDALIKEKQLDKAKQVINKAKMQGINEEKLNALKTQLTQIAQVNKPNLSQQNDKKVPKQNIKTKNPTQQQVSSLLDHYQSGRYDDAEKMALLITQEFPENQFSWKILGAVLKQTGRLIDSLTAVEKSVQLAPQDAAAHCNLGVTLKELERFEEAEASYIQAIKLKPDFAEAHYNLAITLQELDRFDEAEASYTQAIKLKPDFAEAHNNLGNTLHELERFEEAEASLKQAIVLRPNFAEAHSNLGNTLKELGRFDEAKASCKQAIALQPNFAKPHFFLGIIFYSNGDIDAGIESLERAYQIDPKDRKNELVLTVLKARKAREQNEPNDQNISHSDYKVGLNSNPTILNRVVESELIASLYEMQSREMDEARNTPVFGNGKCSLNYTMFNEGSSIIKTLEGDLIKLMESTVNSKIYLQDSFFNIYGAGAGIPPHDHLNKLDRNTYLVLARQKYSLVYYLSVGDQDCSEPGIFKLYDPDEEILPTDGMIVIIPADRLHSAVYGGKKDRIIIGINFYSL